MFLLLLMEWNYIVSRILVIFSSNETFFCCCNCLMLDSCSKPFFLCFNLDFMYPSSWQPKKVFQPGFHHPDTQKHKQLNLLFCLFFMCLNVLCFVCFQYFFLYSLWLNPTYLFGTKVSSKYILPCGRHIWFLRFALSSLFVDIMMCSIFFFVLKTSGGGLFENVLISFSHSSGNKCCWLFVGFC